MSRIWPILMLIAGPAFGAELTGPARVIDGDTLGLVTPAGESIVRLHGIDAPERMQRCRLATGIARACGREAGAALAGLIGGAKVSCTPLDRDRHGRIVARCSVRGRDLGAAMVGLGAAFAYRRYSQDYSAVEAAARAAGRGVWSGVAERPEAYRLGRRRLFAGPAGGCPIKGNIAGGRRIYHAPGGRYYERTRIDAARGEHWFCSPAEAEAAGWHPARR